jgi:hypothetical protein
MIGIVTVRMERKPWVGEDGGSLQFVIGRCRVKKFQMLYQTQKRWFPFYC